MSKKRKNQKKKIIENMEFRKSKCNLCFGHPVARFTCQKCIKSNDM